MRCRRCGGLLVRQPPEQPEGAGRPDRFLKQKIGGRRTSKRLFAGPLSVSYRAVDQEHKMPVLLEVFPHDGPEYAEDKIVRVFRGLAEAARLRHPGVVGVLDLGRRVEYDYVVRELVGSASLRRILEQEGGVPLSIGLPLAEQILATLQAVHRHGLRHGRISPDTVLLDYDGRSRLEHFGRPFLPAELEEFTVTSAGMLTGPCVYIAPEQASDPDAGDIRSDLFSLGAVLYEMLSGSPPYGGESAEAVLEARLEGSPFLRDAVPAQPAGAAEFVARLMAVEPEDRPADPSAALEELHELAVDLSQRTDVQDAPRLARSSGRGRRLVPVLWTALAMALMFAFIVPLWKLWTGAPEQEEQRVREAALPAHRATVAVILEPTRTNGGEQLAPDVRESVLALSALQLAHAGGPLPVEPLRSEGLEWRTGREEAAHGSVEARYVLRITHSPGLGRLRWRVLLEDAREQKWLCEREAECEPDGSNAAVAVGTALDEVLSAAAEWLGLPERRPFMGDPAGGGGLNAEDWLVVGRARAHERRGRLREAGDLLRELADGADRPGFVAVLAAFCEAVRSWEETGGVDFEVQWGQKTLWGRFSLLAEALSALQEADAPTVRAALGRYLDKYPRAVRGHQLLGMWRVQSGSPPDEAAAAFWQALRADPGYMPAAHAAARIAAGRSEAETEKMLARYESLAGAGQTRQLRRYCERVKARP